MVDDRLSDLLRAFAAFASAQPLGLLVVGQRGVADAVLQHARVLELQPLQHALAELLGGGELDACVPDHRRGELRDVLRALAADHEAERADIAHPHAMPLAQLLHGVLAEQLQRGLQLDGGGGGVLRGGLRHGLRALRLLADRRGVPFLRCRFVPGIPLLNKGGKTKCVKTY